MKLRKFSSTWKKISNLKSTVKNNKQTKMRIDQEIDEDYTVAKVSNVGLIVPLGLEGFVILKSDDGKEFPISAFSGETAKYISNFLDEKFNSLPTIYNMVEQICEETEIFLVKAKVYDSGSALRANLYFTGKKDIVLRNFRASDAIALATFYRVPILIRKNLFKEKVRAK